VPDAFDRRVTPEPVLELVRALQRRATSHLAGGAALGGLYLHHRLSADIDLFCHEPEAIRTIVRELPGVARECNAQIRVVQDGGTFVRAAVSLSGHVLELDLVHEALPDLEPPPPPVDGSPFERMPASTPACSRGCSATSRRRRCPGCSFR
jgi:hypothetical protein